MNRTAFSIITKIFICIIVTVISIQLSGQIDGMSKVARKIYKTPAFPGTVQIDSNLYADISEVSNMDYREFLYWTNRVFGKNKATELLPDTSAWLNEEGMGVLQKYYFRVFGYAFNPVIGVSYEQAQAYARWRSDRVFEFLLIREGVIKFNPNRDSTNYFSIENYFAGKYNGIKPDYSIPYPVYSIPTIEEWTFLCMKANEINSANVRRYWRKIDDGQKDKDSLLLRSKENFYFKIKEDDLPAIGLNEVMGGCTKMFYNLQGNVSELSATEGVSLGGSWKNTREEIMASDIFYYTGPNAWTGFRCVCRWEFYQGGKTVE